MRRAHALAVALIFALSASSASAQACLNGKPCGTHCIPFNKRCVITTPPSQPMLTYCAKGKPCGYHCIPIHKVCKLP